MAEKRVHVGFLCVGLLLSLGVVQPARGVTDRAAVHILPGAEADEIERFAARELERYLVALFGVRTFVGDASPEAVGYLVVLDRPSNHSLLARALTGRGQESLSDQGFLLRRGHVEETPAMLIAGGSPRAVLWGVYELVERYGVRYLLHEDVFPEDAGAFYLPEIDRVFEPVFRVRSWRTMGDFAMGTEGWGIADYRPLLDQLAKLRFSRIRAGSAPWQPFLHLEAKGVKREWTTLWYDYRYPVTDDMPGRELFGDEPEFWNPDLPPRGSSYEEMCAAGERHTRALIDYAHRRGIEVEFHSSVIDFPREFRPLIPDAQAVHQLAQLTIGPGPSVRPDHPRLLEVARAVLRSVFDAFPEADAFGFAMPEFREWTGHYEWAWAQLDEKYRVREIVALEELLRQAGNRTGYPGGAQRALNELKGDIVALHYYDLVLGNAGEHSAAGGAPRVLLYNVAEELIPILERVMPYAVEAPVTVDYTSSRVLRRREVLGGVSKKQRPMTTLALTIHDDNVGLVPQLTTGSNHELIKDMGKHGWSGFFTRQWLISDHDPCVAYLSKAVWDTNATPESVVADQVRAVCGESAVVPMLEAFAELEATTLLLESQGGLTFPTPAMMRVHWRPGEISDSHRRMREGYQRALDAVRRAPRDGMRSQGGAYVDYWIGRLEFGVGFFDTIEGARRAASAEGRVLEAMASARGEDFEELAVEAAELAEAACDTAFAAIESYARVAKNRADVGAIATLNEYVYRFLNGKAKALRSQLPVSLPAIGRPAPSNRWDSTAAVRVRADVEKTEGAWIGTAVQTANGTGISLDGRHHGNDPFTHGSWWAQTNPGGTPRGGTVPGLHWIEYEFDRVYPLERLWIWNYNEAHSTAYGMRDVTIEASTTGGPRPDEWTAVYQGTLPQAGGSADEPVSLDLTLADVPARFVVITGHRNHGDPADLGATLGVDGRSILGLSEVRFYWTGGDGPPN